MEQGGNKKLRTALGSSNRLLPPVDLVRAHGGLDTVDLLLFLMVFNESQKYIVVEALAGCGKTAMLSGLVKRLPQKKAVLLLSFTRQAITVARVRAGKAINTQTFDSLFFQTVKHGFLKEMGKDLNTETYTYETMRDLSETLLENDLDDFVGKTDEMYKLADIQVIMVDEAQDTPPQAVRILDTFRRMGKTVIITGDRHQAIFGFMKTQSLFDSIPSGQKVTHHLLTTKRCCAEVAAFINERFALTMASAYASDEGPDALDCVCVQALYNATLGRVYAKFLFTMNCPMEVLVSDGDSTQKFWDAVFHEVGRMYSVGKAQAERVVHQRRKELDHRHRAWSQTPRQWRVLSLLFSTVHHFKGGECDVTVLAEDLDLLDNNNVEDDERIKYVAASRARWGIVALKNVCWKGHAGARRLFRQAFLKCRENASRGTAPRVSSVSDLPTTLVPLIASPTLDPWTTMLRDRCVQSPLPAWAIDAKLGASQAMKVGSLVDILLGWGLEQAARRHRVPEIYVASTEYSASPLKDRKYARMKRDGMIPPELHAELKRILARMKIQATVGRYLVVFHGWPPTSSLVIRAALAKARLTSFMLCGSVAVLERSRLPLAARIRVGQILENANNNLPGILGQPQQWYCLNLQQQMIPNSFFFLRGTYDVLIMDRQQVSHLIEVKTVRTLQPVHCLQALLYTTVLYVSFGFRFPGKWRTAIYESHRNQLHPLDPGALLRLASDDPRVLPELDHVLYAKLLPEYYNNQLSLDTITQLL